MRSRHEPKDPLRHVPLPYDGGGVEFDAQGRATLSASPTATLLSAVCGFGIILLRQLEPADLKTVESWNAGKPLGEWGESDYHRYAIAFARYAIDDPVLGTPLRAGVESELAKHPEDSATTPSDELRRLLQHKMSQRKRGPDVNFFPSARPAEPAAKEPEPPEIPACDHPVAYVTDNPYRLLSLPSSVSPRLLGQKAAAADQARKVGVPVYVSLEVVFGRADLERCDGIVRELSTDAMHRSIYRQMWPYEIPSRDRYLPTPADLATVWSDSADLSDYHGIQINFLHNWFAFAATAEPGFLTPALESFSRLYGDQPHRDYLIKLAQAEGEPAAATTVASAQSELREQIVRDTAQTALRTLEEGRFDSFRGILAALLASDVDPEIVTRIALALLVEYGEQGRRSLAASSEQAVLFLTDRGNPLAGLDLDDRAFTRLNVLAEGLRGKTAGTSDWADATQKHADEIARNLIARCAPDIVIRTGEIAAAYDALAKARKLPMSGDMRSALEERLDSMRRLSPFDWPAAQADTVALDSADTKTVSDGTKLRTTQWIAAAACIVVLIGVAIAHTVSTRSQEPGSYQPPSLTAAPTISLLPSQAGPGSNKTAMQTSAIKQPSFRHPFTMISQPYVLHSGGAVHNAASAGSGSAATLAEATSLQADIEEKTPELEKERQALDDERATVSQDSSQLQTDQERADTDRQAVDPNDQSSEDAYNQAEETANTDQDTLRQAQQEYTAAEDAYATDNDSLEAEQQRLTEITHTSPH